jgi:hypothetical protein
LANGHTISQGSADRGTERGLFYLFGIIKDHPWFSHASLETPRRHPVQPRVDRPTGRENDASREALRTTILEIVDSQIRNHDPPEALATYDRLIGQGHSDEEARRLIGCAIASEVVGIVNESRKYDHHRYLAALEALPRLS